MESFAVVAVLLACFATVLAVPTCDDRLLLHFPYQFNFDDVSCHKAKGYSYGEGKVAFMRNWLRRQHRLGLTVSAWVKRVAGPYAGVGIVDNGDCKAPPTFLLYGDVDVKGNAVAYGAVAPNRPLSLTKSWVIPFGVWTHLAVAFNGKHVTLYVNGDAVQSSAVTGPILSNQNPLKIGMQGCCDCKLNYFKGRIDDVRIYKVALSISDIVELATPPAPTPSP